MFTGIIEEIGMIEQVLKNQPPMNYKFKQKKFYTILKSVPVFR